MTHAEREEKLIRLDERLEMLHFLERIASDRVNRLNDYEFNLVLKLMNIIQQKNEENLNDPSRT